MQSISQTLRDVEGYVVNPEDWNENLARQLATEEYLELTDTHWLVVYFMQEYWHQNKVAPDVRHVTKFLTDATGVDKKGAKQLLFELFPFGYVKQACKIAGMQRPRAWSTG
ncbi:MAG: TusE/DsrC/DsvC family sulfur relay protein [Thiogranum sp.]